MPSIRLNFINQSSDAGHSSIVIFQKNVATAPGETAVAWKLIPTSMGDTHSFTVPAELQVSATDSNGNSTPLVTGSGQYSLVDTASGPVLQYTGAATGDAEVEVVNALAKYPIDARVYRDGELLAMITGIGPHGSALFRFNPTLWIGVVSEVVQGQVLNSEILSHVNSEISLLGILQADIIMSGGGPGTGAQPYEFTLKNIKYV